MANSSLPANATDASAEQHANPQRPRSATRHRCAHALRNVLTADARALQCATADACTLRNVPTADACALQRTTADACTLRNVPTADARAPQRATADACTLRNVPTADIALCNAPPLRTCAPQRANR
eukprot:357121-Chlamydomonas_euryale.AAC.1